MSDSERDQITLRPVAGGGSRRGAWAAVAAVAVLFLAVVLVGRFGGRGPEPPVSSAPSAPTVANPSPAVSSPHGSIPTLVLAVPGSAAPITPPGPSATPSVFSAPRLGFRLVRATPIQETIVELEDRRTIDFVYSRTSLRLGRGTIEVAVGTPAEGADVHGSSGAVVFGDSLAALEVAYRAAVKEAVAFAHGLNVAGQPGLLLELADHSPDGGRHAASVILVVQGGRAYVITADGFDAYTPAATADARQHALDDFLGRITFAGPQFEVFRDLGFEVPGLVDGEPVATAPARENAGSVLFPAGSLGGGTTWSHAVEVDVGTAAHPASVVIRRPNGELPGDGIWGPDQPALEQAFIDQFGAGTSAIRTTVGGERALRINAPGNAGAAVVVAHRGRAYIISTTGAARAEVAPGFDDFLADFRFLDSGR